MGVWPVTTIQGRKGWQECSKPKKMRIMDTHIKKVYPWPLSSIFTSPTGWGPEKSRFWNSQLPLFTTILSSLPTPVLSSTKFPWTILYNWLVFFHHITWSSSVTNSVTLKMEAVWTSKMAEHLSLHSAETRRQPSSAQLPWTPAHIHQVTRIKHKQHSNKSCVSCYFMILTTEYSVTMHAANPHVWATLHYITSIWFPPHQAINITTYRWRYIITCLLLFQFFSPNKMFKHQTVWFKTRHLATLDVRGLSVKYPSILNISKN